MQTGGVDPNKNPAQSPAIIQRSCSQNGSVVTENSSTFQQPCISSSNVEQQLFGNQQRSISPNQTYHIPLLMSPLYSPQLMYSQPLIQFPNPTSNIVQIIPCYQHIVPVTAPIISLNSLSNIHINPFRLGFLPTEIADDKMISLSELMKTHFQTRSTKKIRFEHKLWNALCITKSNPIMFNVVGVMWITNTIMKVHRTVFANLLGITKPTAALFNIQGSFPSHGFVEVDINEARSQVDPFQLVDVDGIQIRLFKHEHLQFTSSSGIECLLNCRWKENFAN